MQRDVWTNRPEVITYGKLPQFTNRPNKSQLVGLLRDEFDINVDIELDYKSFLDSLDSHLSIDAQVRLALTIICQRAT
ncbi:unnamed protein product [marine sediment metagenome]|uniref:Uncharacterized protein n=1 Tax=marine sediment metagenome TaxID=412755 RepID=X1NNE1_9ZZZZ